MKIAGAILDGHAWASNWGNNLGTVLPGSAANIGFNRFVLAPQYDCATITSTSITSANAPADADMVTLVKAAMVAGMTIGLKPLVRPNDGDIQGHLTGGGFVAKNTAVYSTGTNTMTVPGGSFDSTWIGRRVVTPTVGHYDEIPSGLSANAYGLATPTWTTVTAASGTSITLSARPTASSSSGYVVIADDTAAATWFSNYQTILDHLIGLVVNPTGSGGAGCPAARLTVDISTEHDFLHILHDDKWRSLIAHLRATWPGVTLTAGAPAVNGYNVIRCFDVLDYLGATWYRPVQTQTGGETTAVISQNTAGYIATLGAWSAAWSNKQILFTELGFRSVDAVGGSFPAGWQPSQSSGGTAGEISQAQCVRAFLDTIYQQAWFGGFHWWAWAYPQNASSTGEAASFSVTNADGSLKQAAREFSSTLRVVSVGRELAPTVTGTTLVPAALLGDVSSPRVFNGPLDPQTVAGVVLTPGDKWNKAVVPPPVIQPPPPPGGGTQPTGPGIVMIQDLQALGAPGERLSVTLGRLTAPAFVSFPPGVFEMVDFADSAGKVGCLIPGACKGLLGSGIDFTVFQMRPGSSTKVTSVPTTGTNPLYIFRTATNPANGFQASGFTLCGTEQPVDPNTSRPHCYGGIMLDHVNAPQLTDIRCVGIPGSGNSPPGETFQINDFGCTNGQYTRIESDGRVGVGTGAWYVPSFFPAGTRVSASPWGANSSTNPTLTDCNFHHSYASMPTFWQTNSATTFNLKAQHNGSSTGSLSAHGINHERPSGTYHHYNPLIIIDRSPVSPNTGLHMSLMGDQTNIDTVFLHGMVAGVNFDQISTTLKNCFSVQMHAAGAPYQGNPTTQTSPPHLYKPSGVEFRPDIGSVPTGGDPTSEFGVYQ